MGSLFPPPLHSKRGPSALIRLPLVLGSGFKDLRRVLQRVAARAAGKLRRHGGLVRDPGHEHSALGHWAALGLWTGGG